MTRKTQLRFLEGSKELNEVNAANFSLDRNGESYGLMLVDVEAMSVSEMAPVRNYSRVILRDFERHPEQDEQRLGGFELENGLVSIVRFSF